MKIEIELTKEMVEEWCFENDFGLILLHQEGEIRPLSKTKIKGEGIEGILKRVCYYLDMDVSDLQRETRRREILEARQISQKIAHKYIPLSLSKIAYAIGKKDHATVLNSVKKINNLIETGDKEFCAKYDGLIKLYRL